MRPPQSLLPALLLVPWLAWGAGLAAAAVVKPPDAAFLGSGRGALAAALDASPLGWGKAAGELKGAMADHLEALQQEMGARLRKAGVTGDAYDAATAPSKGIAGAALGAMDAVRAAYEATLAERLGAFLDDTTRLRYELQNGEAVIDEIRALRGVTCTPGGFQPPAKQDARVTGAAATLTFSGLSCRVSYQPGTTRTAVPLACQLPSASLSTRAPRYTARFLSPAQAVTEECKVTRRYGLESTVAVTLLDPATFFTENDPQQDAARPSYNLTVTVDSGPPQAAGGRAPGGGGAGGGAAGAPSVRAQSNGLNGGGGGTRETTRIDAARAPLRDTAPRLARLLRNGGAAGLAAEVATEFRERLLEELRSATVQIALEYDRPNIRSNLENTFATLRAIAERNAERRATSVTAVEYADSVLGRLFGPRASFAANLAEEVNNKFNVTAVFDATFARALGATAARRARPGGAPAGPAGPAAAGGGGGGQPPLLPVGPLLARVRAEAAAAAPAANSPAASAAARGQAAAPNGPAAPQPAGAPLGSSIPGLKGLSKGPGGIEAELAELSGKLKSVLAALKAAKGLQTVDGQAQLP